jgi:hypothetical protein
MSAQENMKFRICPLPPEPPKTRHRVVQVVARLRLYLDPGLLKKAGSILILIGAILIFAAQIWISVICTQFVSVWGFDPTLASRIAFPMIIAMSFGILSGTLVLLGAILAYFKNVKIGTSLAIFWALLANVMLALILLLRTEIAEYVFFIPFWQTFALGVIGSFIGILGGGIGLSSLRKPQVVPAEVAYETSQLKTAGWAFTLIGAGIIIIVQLLLLYWYLDNTIFNPLYLDEMDPFLSTNLSSTKIGIFVTLICSIGLIASALIIGNLNAKLGGIFVFIFAIPAFLPFYWSMLQPIYLILLQGTGAGFATGGGILTLAAGLYSYREPPPAERFANPRTTT